MRGYYASKLFLLLVFFKALEVMQPTGSLLNRESLP